MVPHLTFVGGNREEIRSLLKLYRALGCNRVVALRGDTPSGMVSSGDLRYASELVELIRAEHGDHFAIEVAAYPETHPQAEDALADLRHFKIKVDAGADSAITQYFYNTDAYFRFVDDARALGIDIPIVPGIMPISNFSQLRRFSEACGAEIPRWIGQRMRAYGDDGESVREFASDFVAKLCQRLLAGGAPGLHFYTLNLQTDSERARRLSESAGLGVFAQAVDRQTRDFTCPPARQVQRHAHPASFRHCRRCPVAGASHGSADRERKRGAALPDG